MVTGIPEHPGGGRQCQLCSLVQADLVPFKPPQPLDPQPLGGTEPFLVILTSSQHGGYHFAPRKCLNNICWFKLNTPFLGLVQHFAAANHTDEMGFFPLAGFSSIIEDTASGVSKPMVQLFTLRFSSWGNNLLSTSLPKFQDRLLALLSQDCQLKKHF